MTKLKNLDCRARKTKDQVLRDAYRHLTPVPRTPTNYSDQARMAGDSAECDSEVEQGGFW